MPRTTDAKSVASKASQKIDEYKVKRATKKMKKRALDPFFEDYYARRGEIYRINFVRGIFFGVGSVLGGTIVISLIVWVSSFFIDFPLLGDFFQSVIDAADRYESQ